MKEASAAERARSWKAASPSSHVRHSSDRHDFPGKDEVMEDSQADSGGHEVEHD